MTNRVRFSERMNSNDALLWMVEKDPMLRSTMTATFLLDQPPDERVFAEVADRASRLIPRLRQRVLADPFAVASPMWVYDPHFDLSYHARYTRARGDGALRDILDRTQQLCMETFDGARPLWQFEVIDGLADGRAALVIKLHHAVTDALGFLKLATSIFDLERDGWEKRGPMPGEPDAAYPSTPQRFVAGVAHELAVVRGAGRRVARGAVMGLAGTARDPGGSLRQAVALGGSVVRVGTGLEPLSPLTTGRSLGRRFDAMDVPFDDLKGAAKAVGATFNDAFVAATIGGLARYHDRHGAPVAALRMQMPVSMRTDDTAGEIGNQLGLARIVVPADMADPAARMRAVNAAVVEARADPMLTAFAAISSVLVRLGTNVAATAVGAMTRGVDVMTSNVAGLPFDLFVAGCRVEAIYAFTPLAGAPISLALGTWAGGTAHVGIATDPAAVPDPDTLVACLREGFDEVGRA